ncbi:MAG: biotin--[acetyl-CoA-carboxylase] ligase [Acidimicrobiales bacterium]
MLDDDARAALAPTRFGDVRWVAETGSTNADAMALARAGAPEGVVVVADHQTAGRGRQGREWTAPPGSSLLATILLRPPVAVAGLVTMAVALAGADAVTDVAGFAPRLKWPNDLVWPGDGSGADRKLAGVLAEADWPARVAAAGGATSGAADAQVVVAVGIGLNVNWPAALPDELTDVAIACNHVAGRSVERQAILVALLQHLEAGYRDLLADHAGEGLLVRWRDRSSTLGRRVRVELGDRELVGTAVDVTREGHLLLETTRGERHELTMGDVVHLRQL